MSSSSTGSAVYSGLATYGRIRSIITLVVVGIFCLVFLVLGISLARKDPSKTSKTTAKVTVITPNLYKYTYNVDKKEYTGVANTSVNGNYVGKTIDIYYNPHSPGESREGKSKRTIGFILIVASILILSVTALITYFTMKSKTFAAIQGGADIVNSL